MYHSPIRNRVWLWLEPYIVIHCFLLVISSQITDDIFLKIISAFPGINLPKKRFVLR